MKHRNSFLAAALLGISMVVPAEAASIGTCEGCTAWEMKDLAINAGVGTRYVVDYHIGTMKKYEVTQNGSYFRTATERPLESIAAAGFQKLHSLFVQNPQVFASSHMVTVPIDEIGGMDPVALSLFGPEDQFFFTFRFNLNQFLSNYDRVRQYNQRMADALDGTTTITRGLNIPYTPFYAEQGSTTGGAFEVSFCEADGDCAIVDVRSDGSWTFIGTRDAFGNMYPRPDSVVSPHIPSGVEWDNYLARVRAALAARGINFIGAAAGAQQYMTCAYRGRTLIGCRVE